MQQYSSSIFNQSGVIPFRYQEEKPKILLITSRSHKRWIIPKGIIENDLSPAESAVKEAYEEAGIRGKLYPNPIGKYKFNKWGGTVTVAVFLLEVTRIFAHWPESSFRERKWVSIQDAAELVDIKGLKDIIRKLCSRIHKPRQV